MKTPDGERLGDVIFSRAPCDDLLFLARLAMASTSFIEAGAHVDRVDAFAADAITQAVDAVISKPTAWNGKPWTANFSRPPERLQEIA